MAERMLGRPLRRDEEVHHRNGVKTDNRPENLQVLSSAEHQRIHWSERHYEARVRAQTKPDAACSGCGWFGHLRAKGMCAKCYQQDYYRRHPEKWA